MVHHIAYTVRPTVKDGVMITLFHAVRKELNIWLDPPRCYLKDLTHSVPPEPFSEKLEDMNVAACKKEKFFDNGLFHL